MISKAYGNALISLLLDEPFYAHILSELQPVVASNVPIAAIQLATPIRLLINSDNFDRLKPKHQIGILKHEVLHLVMEHFIRRGGRDPHLFNLAADLAIHELIKPEYLPPNVATVPSIEQLLPPGVRLPRKAAAEVYYEILEKYAVKVEIVVSGGESGAGSSGTGMRVRVTAPDGSVVYDSIDDHSISETEDSIAKDIIKELVRQMVESAIKSCGSCPAGLEEYITAMRQTAVNWRRVLSRFLLGRGRMVNTPSYMRESKRYDNYPGRRKQIGMQALVAIDTSGSMTDSELADILAHLLQIKKISGTKIWVVWGDTQHEGGPILIDKVGNRIKIKGRGGTDLRWPFEIADKMRIPTLVYFTDGYGPAPEAATVKQRVIWAITPNGTPPADYGYTLKMDNSKR